jgi:hypothetical protein
MKQKKVVMKSDFKDASDWTLRKGTVLFVLKALKHPVTKQEVLAVAVDNGTDNLDLMPKTVAPANLVREEN